MGETLDLIAHYGMWWELYGLGKGIDRLREEQLRAAQEIVASLGLVEEQIDRLRQSVERQTTVIEHGFNQLDQRLESLTLLQAQALRVMKYRRDTDALAARENGERALRNRYYEEALDDFKRALSDNKYDFIAHYLTALILWEEGGNPAAATESCNACIKYTKMWNGAADDPTPRYYESRAQVVLGRIAEGEGQLRTALDHYLRACELSPDHGECFRRCGAAALAVGDRDLAVECVRAAMCIDPGEFVHLLNDDSYESLRKEVFSISEELRDQQVHAIDAAREAAIDWANALADAGSTFGRSMAVPDDFSSLMQRVSATASGGFIDVAYVPSELTLAAEMLLQCTARAREQAENFVQERARSADAQIDAAKEDGEMARHRWQRKADGFVPDFLGYASILFALGVIPPILIGVTIYSYNSGELAWTPAAVGIFTFAFIIVIWEKMTRASRAKDRGEAEATTIVAEASQKVDEYLSQANNRVGLLIDRIEESRQAFLNAKHLFDNLDISCSLILVDLGSCESPQSSSVVETLQGILHELGESRSAPAIKSLLMDLPAFFVKNAPVYQAEEAASFIRRELGLTVGVKRRYTRTLRRLQPAISGPSPD